MISIAIVIIAVLPLLVSTVAIEAAVDFSRRLRERSFARRSRSDLAQHAWHRIGQARRYDYKGRLGFPK